ncbi:MAG TPA: dephospho-CoA kinase [Syntrophus sp. (in: bacteria)]|nr:dephospho-CoA kinase [Syntrophus sp. (in: bacteria)]
MLNVGLTGGIACGKTTVAEMLVARGAHLIDFDALAHEVEAPDRPAWRGIVSAFGEDVLNADRTIDRLKLGAIVFQDKAKLQTLNGIVHPAVFDAWRRRMDAIVRDDPRAIILSDVPLLFEVGMAPLFDLVALVYISPAEQVDRLMKRNGFTAEEARARLAAQMSIDEKVRRADVVIDNQGTVEETRRGIAAVWADFVRREEAKRMS